MDNRGRFARRAPHRELDAPQSHKELLVEHLTGEDERVTTGNLARIDLAIDSWQELPDARGELAFLLRPRELKQAPST